MNNLNIKQIQFNDLERLLKSNELSFFNIYNGDINPSTYLATKYYFEHKYDNIDMDQKIQSLFIDIELYSAENTKVDLDIQKAQITINAVSILSNFTNEIIVFYLILDKNFNQFGLSSSQDFNYGQFIINKQNMIKQYLVDNNYMDDTFSIKLELFLDERELLKSLWNTIHHYDPDVLSGWNIDLFDLPYMYFRLSRLFGTIDASRLMSKLGKVTVKNNYISIPDYGTSDLLYLYKPRDEGGLNLGKKQPQYTLDFISNTVLGMGKIEYKNKSIDLDDLYTSDPDTFIIYNIVDTLLCSKLDKNLKHIDLYNGIRRIMKTPISYSMVGSSALFDTFVFYKLMEEEKYVRCGINSEQNRSIEPDLFTPNQYIKDKKGLIIQPPKISSKVFNQTVMTYPGAFVKIPEPKIINNGSIIIDLDATSLYPSMILQSNISFDAYHGRILPICTYKTLELLEKIINKEKIPEQVYLNIQKLVFEYADRESIDRKKEMCGVLYYIIIFLLNKLQEANIEIDKIYSPSTTQESLVLKNILIPFLDLINLIHPDNPKYSRFAYDYFFLHEKDLINKYQFIYIIHNAGESDSYIKKYDLKNGIDIIKNYCITLAGTLFEKHDKHIGLFSNFLINMGNMRREYKNKRDENKDDPYEYILNENRQKSVKVIMNTLYGLYGLNSFRYSNNWLAQSITNNGQLVNKIAQYISEEYLKFKFCD